MPDLNPIKSAQLSNTQQKELYKQRLKEDHRLKDNSVITIANGLFENVNQKNVVQPFENKTLDLSQDFWDFRPVNGLQALKRGFFKIVGPPEFRDILGVQTLSAYVLYNAGNDLNTHYLYYANVGTMVNKYAIGFDLAKKSSIMMPPYSEKKQFLERMKNKVFYVSRAEFVTDAAYGQMKEVLWFKTH